MNKFQVKFTETKKYLPATRTITVETVGNFLNAMLFVKQEFGSKEIIITNVYDENGTDLLGQVTQNVIADIVDDEEDESIQLEPVP